MNKPDFILFMLRSQELFTVSLTGVFSSCDVIAVPSPLLPHGPIIYVVKYKSHERFAFILILVNNLMIIITVGNIK